jgi:integrase
LEQLRGKLGRDEDRLLVDFLVATGLRVSEVIALDWLDVDFGHRRVTISKRNYRGDLDRPKSAMSRRDVRISQGMAQRLWELRKSREHATDEDPIFTTKTGKRHNYGNLYHCVLKPAMRAAGIEHGGFHRLATHAGRNSDAGARAWRKSNSTLDTKTSASRAASTSTWTPATAPTRGYSTIWQAATRQTISPSGMRPRARQNFLLRKPS